MRIAIVGAGFTGLTAGYELVKQGHRVTLYEKENYLGGLAGVINSRGRSWERSYHHFFASDAAVCELIAELDLAGQLAWLMPRNAIYANRKLYPFTTPRDLLNFKELHLEERIALGLLIFQARTVRDWLALEEYTAREWIVRKAGRRVYEAVWEPLLVSKFDCDAASIGAVWIWNKLKLRGSTRGKNSNRELLGYLQGSTEVLLERLAERIRSHAGSVNLSEPVLHLRPEGSSVRVTTARGTAEFDKVIVTTAPEVFLRLAPELPAEYRARLGQIRYKANLCLILELDRPLSEYYWITVAEKECPFVAVIEQTNLTPWEVNGERTHLVYLSRYLEPDAPFFNASDATLFECGETFLTQMFPHWPQVRAHRLEITRSRYAQPVIGKRYSQILPAWETSLPNVYLADMAQIYPEDRGVNHAVQFGKRIAALIGNMK